MKPDIYCDESQEVYYKPHLHYVIVYYTVLFYVVCVVSYPESLDYDGAAI